MRTGLNKQVYIFSVDTSAFYNSEEIKINNRLMKVKQQKGKFKSIIELVKDYISLKNEDEIDVEKLPKVNEKIDKLTGKSELEVLNEKLIEINSSYEGLQGFEKLKWELKNNESLVQKKELEQKINDIYKMLDLVAELISFNKKKEKYIINKKSRLYKYNQLIGKTKKRLEKKLDKAAIRVNETNEVRKLRKSSLKKSNLISQFESSLTRSIGIKEDETSTDIIVIRAYRYVIFEQLMKNGFIDENGNKYQYFTSSAGGMRNKKSLWIKTKVYNKIRNKLMCGLSVKEINKKGGMNLNKFNAYTALCMTASTPWTDFDITKAIVVPDFITSIKDAEVDYIDHETYEIERKEMDVEIPHTDGAGMYLPKEGEENKTFQMRMPFFKGLMIPFLYDKFIETFDGNSVVKDIYGKEHNVISEGIRYIFTESQFKMANFFKNWDEYKINFLKYGCEASVCKEAPNTFEDKTLNYQVLQSLNEMKPEYLSQIASRTISEIEGIGTNLEIMKRLIGSDETNERKNSFQKAVEIYPQLINDVYSREVIKEKKKSLVKAARSGKLILDQTFRTYIAPDLFSFAEWLFLGIEEPNGLLNNGEVSCQLYEDEQKLDVLRSPHNYREHCVRINKTGGLIVHKQEVNIKDWFITNDIFTSVKDTISTQLFFDVDGDDALIVSSPLFTSIAEEHMRNIRPLQFKLASANKEKITNENLFKALIAAYSKAPMIGNSANDICKIWNSGNVGKEELDLIRILTFEGNAYIDYAKTLWLPKRPKGISEKLKIYSNKKVPHFFKYAKDKKSNQVEPLNDSVVNQLNSIIKKTIIKFEDVAGIFNYKELMSNKDYELTEADQIIIDLYIKENQEKTMVLKDQMRNQGEMTKKGIELQVYKEIKEKFLQLSNSRHVTDVLIKYLYEQQDDKHKQTLWYCFGWEIVRNLQWNINGIRECKGCHETIESPKVNQVRCDSCQKERKREVARLRKQRQREKEEMSHRLVV